MTEIIPAAGGDLTVEQPDAGTAVQDTDTTTGAA